MKSILLKSCILFLLTSTCLNARGNSSDNWSYFHQLENRRQVVLSALAGQTWMRGDDHRRRIYLGVVKLFTGIDEKTGLQYLQDAVDDPAHWGCFNVYAMMDAILRLGHKLPPDLVEQAKNRIAENFTADKGFTENHKLQYRTARYLFGQTWPDGPTFKDGMTPLQGKEEAETWIDDWIDRTVTVGMLEYDSVNYFSLYYLCMTSLYDFSTDPIIKRKAWMIMQLLLADHGSEYLRGNWIGGHSREKYNQVLHTTLNCGTAIPFGYLFFGDSHFHPELPETYYVGLGAVQGFRPLPMIGNIATDRTTPYVHKETKAPRRGFGINTNDVPTWKYDYVTRNYALGSSYGDLTAVENHRWDLTWVSPNDGSTCFFINPSFSAKQLLKYFKDDPDKILEDITRQRPYYKDPNKWIEGSPFEQLLQYENTIIALYNIPKTERNRHVNGFFSKIIEERTQSPDGWIFCSTDSVYFAVKTFTKGTWHEKETYFRLTLTSLQTGLIMEVSQKSEYPSFKAFQAQIKSNPLRVNLKNLQVVYTDSRGNELNFTYGKNRLVNGKNIDFTEWPLFQGPFINAKKGSKIFEITYGVNKVVLDFNDLTIKFSGFSAHNGDNLPPK